MGVDSSDSITKYIKLYDITKEKRAKYPFSIFNTDRENKLATHWWSFLDIFPKHDLLLFDSFGFYGFKQFIIDNGSGIIDQMLFNLKKHRNSHINLVSLTFLIKAYNKIEEKNSLENLAHTAKYFFHMISQFSKLEGQKKTNKNYNSRRSTSRTCNRHMRNIPTLLI